MRTPHPPKLPTNKPVPLNLPTHYSAGPPHRVEASALSFPR